MNIQRTIEDNKAKAVFEELNCVLDAMLARGLFHSIYKYMLYNDTPCFLSMLDYRKNLKPLDREKEDYFLFKYMLQQMRKKYPSKLFCLISTRQKAA
ncbi:hypothetical protein DXT99_18570 [Pontibacter diazotrophicus]|uniref:Uncharacterized protein n=1 Tax=Pontibacter diazotrophicus TaxID=1400979 RepID=A0A3D8L847_9BACT|nr:hypothetical protein DXT99_18570 [Pontibacter diazotrophicus]